MPLASHAYSTRQVRARAHTHTHTSEPSPCYSHDPSRSHPCLHACPPQQHQHGQGLSCRVLIMRCMLPPPPLALAPLALLGGDQTDRAEGQDPLPCHLPLHCKNLVEPHTLRLLTHTRQHVLPTSLFLDLLL